MLGECNAGDLVAVDDGGATIYVLVGRVLQSMKKKGGEIHGALVDLVDPETLLYIPGSWRSMDHQLEVLAVVETASRRRELLALYREARMRRATGRDAYATNEDEVDPMLHGVAKVGGGW